jgi:hypothetical protein
MGEGTHTAFWRRNLVECDHLEDRGLDGTLTLMDFRDINCEVFIMLTLGLLYGSETSVSLKKIEIMIQSAEMRFLRSVEGCYRMDRMRSEEIKEDLDIFSICDNIESYRESWIKHAETMAEERAIRKKISSTRMKIHGRPRKRWIETGRDS